MEAGGGLLLFKDVALIFVSCPFCVCCFKCSHCNANRDVRCGFTSFIKKHFREVFDVKKFDNKKGQEWIDQYKDLREE